MSTRLEVTLKCLRIEEANLIAVRLIEQFGEKIKELYVTEEGDD